MKFKIPQFLIRQVGVKNCADCPTTYRYINPVERHYYTDITGYGYHDANISIFKSGHIVVKEDAGSDGCTPVWLVGDRVYMGIYNGPKVKLKVGDKEQFEPITARAFYLHDKLLDTRHETGIPVELIHQAFCDELKESGWWLHKIYCRIVKRYGPQD